MTQQSQPPQEVRILHMSDTHGCHRQIEQRFGPFPDNIDIIVHTGDMTNQGLDSEFADFDAWLGELKQRYSNSGSKRLQAILCVVGNHCVGAAMYNFAQGQVDPNTLLDGSYFAARMRNARVLGQETVEVAGVRVHGSSWVPWHSAGNPGPAPRQYTSSSSKSINLDFYEKVVRQGQPQDTVGLREHYYDLIPEQTTDVLLVHCPPAGILDCLEGSMSPWGSSAALLAHIKRAAPKVVCFGHVHENRGFWQRAAPVEQANNPDSGDAVVSKTNNNSSSTNNSDDYKKRPWVGRIEYLHDEKPLATHRPTMDTPVQVFSNAALLNHGGIDRAVPQITGRPRIIVGRRNSPSEPWSFSVDVQEPCFFPPQRP